MIPVQILPPPNPKHINTDLRLMNAYLRNDFQPHFNPRNLSELSSVLTNRLQHRNISREEKQRSYEWLARREFDIKPLLDTAKERQKEYDDNNRKFKIDNPEVIQPTLLEQEEYIQRTTDSSLNRMFVYAATNRNIRRDVFNTLIRRLNCFQGENKTRSERHLQVGVPCVVRNPQKRKKYTELTVELLKRQTCEGESFDIRHWALLFSQCIDHKIWNILLNQIRNINSKIVDGSRDKLQQILITNSLLVLQEEFDEDLPRNSDAIASYLQQRYLCRLQPGEYIVDSHLGCIWGKVFLLFRAGRIKELSTLLEQYGLYGLSRDVQQQNKHIRTYLPQRKDANIPNVQERDIFLEQLLYALSGQRKYSSAALSDLTSYDSIWILLRNTGVFYDSDKETFEQIQQQMVQYYINNCRPADCTYFLAYLLSYDSIARLGDNETLDRDDYLHLLVILNKYPYLCINRKMLCSKLTETLISYALELSRENQSQMLLQYYLSLIPDEDFIQQASTIIVANKFYQRLHWKVLSQVRPKDFLNLLKKSTEKYVKQSGDYLIGAQTLMEWMQRQKQMQLGHVCAAIDMLIALLIRNATNLRAYDAGEVKEALKLIQRWISGEAELQRYYQCLLELFENERRLSKYLIDRNYPLLRSFFGQEGFQSIFFNNIDFLKGKMFQKLIQLQGIDVFFLFLKNLIRAADLVFSYESTPVKSKDVRFEVMKMCKLIQQHERFGREVKEESIGLLVNSLRDEMVTISIFQ